MQPSSYSRHRDPTLELCQGRWVPRPGHRPGSLDSFEDEDEQDYVNVQPSHALPQLQPQPPQGAEAKPVTAPAPGAARGGCGRRPAMLWALLGLALLLSAVAFILSLLKWLPCCPAGWDGFQGQCYRVFTASQNWSQARATCRDHDALLATVQGPAEQRFLTQRIGSDWHWIGLQQLNNSSTTWLWEEGATVSYTSWCQRSLSASISPQPSCGYLNPQCGGDWGNTMCQALLAFVCERPGPLCQ
ncbi:C-type lectin lectoxin-Lio3-like [Alligator sinensis]|uniref:C-type lectin lectoxin-Lio3-like n=1 Tax=Alligator sinensis TaxID=38654 RepID=A0A1U7SRA6_ALLSI|nr:C-type lectin lectoxin-Lio3-like [Alligator sinensis]